MYNSPIDVLIAEIQNQIVKQQDKDVYQAVLQYVQNMNKEELIRALKYDRGQYDKGYADGVRDARNEIVHCEDCTYWGGYVFGFRCKKWSSYPNTIIQTLEDDFCSYGERKEGAD